jgi:hypothetical protein
MAIKGMKLNNSTVTRNALAILKETLELAFDDDGTPYAMFALAEGKGIGKQVLRLAQYDGMVEVLQNAVSNGIEEGKKELTASEMVDRTIALDDDGFIMFRATSGKGAKPTKCKLDELQGIVAYLSEVAPTLREMAEKAANA